MSHRGAAELQKFPSIDVYLEDKHPKLWKLIHQCGLSRALTPRGRDGGVTFLLPDAKYMAEIDKKLSSGEPEEATEMISSLILCDFYPTVRSMEGKTVVNRLNKKVIIKEIKAAEVVVDDGKIKVDPAFRPMSHVGASTRGNMAVWQLTGKVEFKNVPSGLSMKKREEPKKNEEKTEGANETNVCELYRSVMEEKKKVLAGPRGKWQPRTDPTGKVYCPVLVAVAKIMSGMRALGLTDQEEMLMSVGCGVPTTDFVLLCCSGLFDCHKICEAHETGTTGDSAVETYKNFWRQTISMDVLTLNPEGRRSLNEDMSYMKDQVASMTSDRAAASDINAFYKDLCANKGSFGGNKIFSDSVMRRVGKDCCRLRCVQAVVFGMGAALYAMEETKLEDKSGVATPDLYCEDYFLMLSEFVTSNCELVDVSGVFEDPGVKSAVARNAADENIVKFFRMAFLLPTGDDSDKILLGGNEPDKEREHAAAHHSSSHGDDLPPVHSPKLDEYEHAPAKMNPKIKAIFRHYVTSQGFSSIEDLLNSLK